MGWYEVGGVRDTDRLLDYCSSSAIYLVSVMTLPRQERINAHTKLYFTNSVVDACTVNAFKARLDKFWKHQSVKFDFTADLIVYNYDADLEVSDTCARSSLLS